MIEILMVLGGLAAFVLWFAILARWKRGVVGLVCFVPFAGAVILFAHHNVIALLAKDLLFVVPLYFSLFILRAKQVGNAVRPAFVLVMALLVAIVLVECANPTLPNLMVAAIGAKVWLFYLPLVFVGAAYLSEPGDLVKINRLMLVVAIVPAGVGILEWSMAQIIGYVQTFTMLYGREVAEEATANFGRFDFGANGTIYRIPSTFSFVSQYFGFLLAMLVPAYITMRTDPSPKWRHFAQFMIYFLAVAAVLSGSRQAYVFVPFMIVLMAVLEGRLSGILASVVILPIALIGALALAGLDPLNLLGTTENLAGRYSNEFFLRSPAMALDEYPLGAGTGMDTGPARYAFPGGNYFAGTLDFNVESFYVKSIVELGALGLLIVLALFAVVIVEIMRIRRDLPVPALKSAASAYAAFAIVMMINSVKGWQLDQDPINVYFWLFAGFAFKLPALAPAVLRYAQPAPITRQPMLQPARKPVLVRRRLPNLPS